MGRLTSLLLLLTLVGVGCKPKAQEAAVRLKVSYTFNAGCITVTAKDAEGTDRETRDQLAVLDRETREVVFAVFRQESWSHTLEITTTAHEKSCEGNVVARDVSEVTLQKKGAIEQVALTLEAPDEDGDGYISTDRNGTDCDDKTFNVDDPITRWYADKDGDGFGDPDVSPLRSCTKPEDSGTTRYVQNAKDCKDSDPAVYPRADVSEARCDEVDDDCDGTVDEGFETKGDPCDVPCPGGQLACNDNRNALFCKNAPTPTLYYPDADGDGAGDERGTPAQVCPDTTPPTGFVLNTDDCDDQDKYNRHNKAEVCDDRDNNCDKQRDEENICGGKGWKVVNDPALTGNSRQWKTVALGADGRVWMAGDGGKLAIRPAAGAAFKSLDGSCGNVNWRAAWVSPNNNHVFLAGSGGNLAEHDGENCSNQITVSSGNTLEGLTGFSPLLYVVDDRGRLYVWSPGVSLEERYNLDPQTYFDIHGLDSTKLLTVGDTGGSSTPYISSYPGTGSTATYHSVSTPNGYSGALRGVWMASSNIAYAVGDGGLVVKWDGATNWTRVNPPTDNTTAPFTSVVAPDSFTIYVTDASTNGTIRRLSAAGTWSTAYTADKPLRDIAIYSSGDIWAVGDDGRVIHFPE
ncbi:putative metal-binding motif-containing protein [Archangium lipolyticum]|uniref:putative metal-binding motif-containing protein n=1 Tax=Archangium lipolyticum TaxID=2970465 RepID=UPI00214A1E2F|nr:putative metal-binding motif-containing protein [Archangium lipolyticum]